MPARTLVACLFERETCGPVIETGTALARKWSAHLIGLHAIDAIMVYPSASVAIPPMMMENFEAIRMGEAAAIRERFEAATAGESFVAEWRLDEPRIELAVDRIIDTVRPADLALVAQADRRRSRNDHRQNVETIIRESGRPVLSIPQTGLAGGFGRSAVIGWSPTREATRAAHDAIPLLDPGAQVHLVEVGAGGGESRSRPATDLAAALDRHGLKVTVTKRDAGGSSVAAVLMREALEVGADMIATGAFGHSRAYDFLVGAVTNELLREAGLPVLFSR